MTNRSKHLSDNFETRQVFNVVNKNLSIEQPFDDVNDDDDENMEIVFTIVMRLISLSVKQMQKIKTRLLWITKYPICAKINSSSSKRNYMISPMENAA